LDGNALIKLGEISFKEQNFDEAFDYHLKAFSYNDIDFKTKLFWMSEYVRKFNYENNQVIQLSEKLELNHPNEEMILILRADISNKIGKLQQAKDYYQKAALVNPSDFRTWKKILELNTKLNLKEDQLETTLKLLALFPNMTSVYIYRAQVLLDHNLVDQAKKNG
jgi:tetratricopeptide (TPR) repeat protein